MDQIKQNEKHSGLQHEGKMPLRDRIEESQAYGEKYRAEHAGADEREAVKPLHAEKVKPAMPQAPLDENSESEENSDLDI